MPTNCRKRPLPSHARVSTEEEDTDPQLDELRAAGSVTLAGALLDRM
jgi:hypothetical protein